MIPGTQDTIPLRFQMAGTRRVAGHGVPRHEAPDILSCGFAAGKGALSRPCRGTLPRLAGEGKAGSEEAESVAQGPLPRLAGKGRRGAARTGRLVSRREGGKPFVGHKNHEQIPGYG
jgi:hypothetical protein